MNQKKIFKIFIFDLLFCFLFGEKIFAVDVSNDYYENTEATSFDSSYSYSENGYRIDAYDIKMKVNENNTFDITETITANFTGSDKHGIYRKIPLKNKIERVDGTKTSNIAKISNINVNAEYETYNSGGYKVIKIGDPDQTVYGEKQYIIRYTYNIGKDPIKDSDELYFNLIGNDWDTNISNVTFSIYMPKSFDEKNLGFSSGLKGEIKNTNIKYSVDDNIISGSLVGKLAPGEGLTVRVTLPEGYFVGASSNVDIKFILELIVSILTVVISYSLWKKYGKDDAVVETVEFYPPDDLNSVDIGYIYKGYAEKKDAISLLIYLANKGYLKIEEFGENGKFKKNRKNKEYKIIKLKEYDGTDDEERIFLNGLFKNKTEVTKIDLEEKFYKTLDKICEKVRKKNKEKIFDKTASNARMFSFIAVIIVFIFMITKSILTGESEMIFLGCFIVFPLLFTLCNKNSKSMIITTSIAFVIVGFLCMAEYIVSDLIYFWQFIIESICIVLNIIFIGIMEERTTYGNEIYGKILGFKNFLKTAEKPKLEELVMEDPEYFYNILPYTYVLGVSDKWMKKFEGIALEPPDWYYGYTSFDYYTFNNFMDSTYSSISSAMTSIPSSDGSSFSSGGGFSGGGSGRWRPEALGSHKFNMIFSYRLVVLIL